MKDVHDIFTQFKSEFPEINEANETFGRTIHEAAAELPEQTRWLIKIAMSAGSGHHRALETHIVRAREAGAAESQILETLLLLIPTCGFPAFMEAYSSYKRQ